MVFNDIRDIICENGPKNKQSLSYSIRESWPICVISVVISQIGQDSLCRDE